MFNIFAYVLYTLYSFQVLKPHFFFIISVLGLFEIAIYINK